jgi:hypothetical protein
MKLDRNKYLESRSLKPRTIFVSILIINLILGAIAFVYPEDGINLGAWNLKFLSYSDLNGNMQEDSSRVVLSEVLEGVEPKEEAETAVSGTSDSLKEKIVVEVKSASFYDTIKEEIRPEFNRGIQLPENNPNILDPLIEGLYTESRSKVIRILHYGDSQLEGDRISDYLRKRLQTLFGGSGPGIVLPLEPAASSRRTVFVSESKNFKKQAIYVKGSKVAGNNYGIGGSTFMVNGVGSKYMGMEILSDSNVVDSTARFSGNNKPAYVKVRNTRSTYSSIQMLYASKEPYLVQLTSDNFIDKYVIPAAPNGGTYKWNIPTKKQLKVEFKQGNYPKLYGLALDGSSGVAIDNFAMRGSAAIGFNKMNTSLYAKQCKQLNVRCILLQYGINVVPNVRSDYTYYKNILVKQLNAIKAANPNVTIIVIGPSDMSKNVKGVRQSYSNIPLIRDAMRNAAFESGCAFWDLYEAMGGQNSMVSWVQKGLGQKDYTHFSFKGAKYAGELLFEAILEKINEKYPSS